MLSRFVRIQLAIFTIASIVGVLVMVFAYMQVPTLLGIGKITVKLELPASGGLYRFANVTYRGVEVGKVTEMDVSRNEATATLTLNTSPKIPADLTAEVRSVSAVGEQYVELLPRTESPPYLQDGSVIAMRDTKIPQQVGPMLDQVSTLINSIPKEKLSGLVDESFNAFNGSGYDLGSLIDSSSKISGDLNRVGDRSSALIEDTGPLLDSQAQTTDDTAVVGAQPRRDHRAGGDERSSGAHAVAAGTRRGERGLAAVRADQADVADTAGEHDDVRSGRGDLPAIARAGSGVAAAVRGLHPVLGPREQRDRYAAGRLQDLDRGPPAVHGRLLAAVAVAVPGRSRRRSTLRTGCIANSRRIRRSSCAGRATIPAWVCRANVPRRSQQCYSDKPYEPLAMRQHALGPRPIDPNLIAQGMPPDDRVDFNDRIFAPTEGTPLPPGAAIPPGPPGAAPPPPDAVAPQAPEPPRCPWGRRPTALRRRIWAVPPRRHQVRSAPTVLARVHRSRLPTTIPRRASTPRRTARWAGRPTWLTRRRPGRT